MNLLTILAAEKRREPGLTYGYDDQVQKLTIRGAKTFPSSISPFADQIKILDMSHGELSALPKELEQFKKLKVAFFSFNNFTEIPAVIGKLKSLEFLGMKSCQISKIESTSLPSNLRWLTLTDNLISALPGNLFRLEKLEKLLLAGNKLTYLPLEITDCHSLALLRISANKLEQSPIALISQLPQLAWYADAGNPFSLKKNPSIPRISWNKIRVKKLISESAQNKVFLAKIKNQKKEVAVKVFGGAVTSDGYARDDMLTNILAGNHSNVVEVIGQVFDVPDNHEAVILTLIPKSFKKLGHPPNFETISRDTYPQDTVFSLAHIFKILRGVVQAQAHLHQRGIMNGDLYAHNILVDEKGEAIVGDFGSASLYVPETESVRELIDVKAFGYLMDDLLNQCSEQNTLEFNKLDRLKKQCLNPNPKKRPRFAELEKLLGNSL